MLEFEALMIRFERLVYTVCYRILNNEDDAKDITQEVFIKLYENMGSMKRDSEQALKGWLCKVAHNKCIDFLRKRRTVMMPADELPEMIDTEPNPEQAVLQNEAREDIESAINKLGYEHREVLFLRDVQGFSYEEIAKITGASMGTVKSRVFRARDKLKKLL